LRGIGEIRSHAPPNPGKPAGQIELSAKLGDHAFVAVGFEKCCGKRQPLSVWHGSYQIEQEYQ
jgi:hypothetical protein